MPDILIVNKEGMEWRRVIICRKCSNDGEEIKEWSESNSRFIWHCIAWAGGRINK